MWVRKTQAGATSTGYVWPSDGSSVEVPEWHGLELLAIPDGGFTVGDPPREKFIPTPAPVEVTEPAPAVASEAVVVEPAPKPRRGRKPAEG